MKNTGYTSLIAKALLLFLPVWISACSVSNPDDLIVKPKTGAAKIDPVTTNSIPANAPWTVLEKFREYQDAALTGPPTGDDVGGNEGLVHFTIGGNTAFIEMAKANNRSSYTPYTTASGQGKIVDNLGNVWVFYTPSSMPIFQQKGYNVKKSIDWSTQITTNTGPNSKLRFTQD